jgi:two-component system response regulator DevR
MDRKLKILVVDDSPLVAPRIRSLLDNLAPDITVGEAENATETLGLMEEVTPDVVLLDLNLGQENGVELLTQIKMKYSSVIVVVFTNHSEAYYKEICREAGADYFFDKSTEFEMLPKMLQQLAEKQLQLT